MFLILFLSLPGCSKHSHEIPPAEAVVTIGLNTGDVADFRLDDIHLFWFDRTDRLVRHDYYGSEQELYRSRVVLPAGDYTVLAVLNVGAEFTPPAARSGLPDTDLSSVAGWIKTQTDTYPDMLTGTLRHAVKNGEQQIYIDLAPKDEGVNITNVELLLTLPSPRLPDYPAVRSASVPALRGVAEIYRKGTSERITVQRAMLAGTDNGDVYRFDLSLWEGEYDIDLWVDYATDATTDNHYITTGLNPVRILPRESYVANTDMRDAFAGHLALDVPDVCRATGEVTLYRPMAKYRLVATDISEYNGLREERGWPALEDLTIKVTYEASGRPPTVWPMPPRPEQKEDTATFPR